MAKTFKFGENGKWATKTGSSMAYNDQNGNFKPMPFAVTRASSATRVNKEGLIEVVGNDKLRIDYTDSSNGVALLEPARQNELQYSEDFTQSVWTKDSTSLVSGFISPDGAANAYKLVENSSVNVRHRIYSEISTVSDGATLSTSIFVKSAERSWILLRESTTDYGYYFNNGVVGSKTGSPLSYNIESFPNGWYRYTVTTVTPNTSGRLILSIVTEDGGDRYDGDGTSGVYIFGGQLEQGSYATSYIPTSGSTYEREADVANGAGNAQVFNDSEGVLFANIAALADDGTNRRLSISEGLTDDQNRMNMMFTTTSNQIVTNYKAAGTTRVIFNTVLSDVTKYIKVAMLYKSGDFRYFVNGFKIDTDSNTTMISDGTLSELAFEDGTDSNNFYGKTKEIGVYDAVLTDAELEALTSYTSFTNMANELNLTIK